MSALAEMLAGKGHVVTGSDRETSVFTGQLAAAGIAITIGHAAENVGDADVLVYTPAVDHENAELVEARERGIRIVRGKALLGALTTGKRVIAVSGTHGKTTTTAMITQICETAGLDPTAFVGGAMHGAESNLRVGMDDVWIVEADEYDRAFLELSPSVAVVTSLEADHLDLYESQDEIVATFDAFLSGIEDGGTAVICGDYPSAEALTVPSRCVRKTYGNGDAAELKATDFRRDGLLTTFTVKLDGRESGDLTIRLPGEHNVSNALGAVGAALSIDVPWESIQRGLSEFNGVRRRFEVMGDAGGITVVNDYAHHPTEIEQTIRAARTVCDGRIVAVFQPHLYSRTRDFADAFCSSLSSADLCWLTDIYPAREAPIPGVSGQFIADGIQGCFFEGSLDKLGDAVIETVEQGDLVLVMGAGSIETVAEEIARKVSERSADAPTESLL
jgi:UDP-N-acetylmuramate--alanine ligase